MLSTQQPLVSVVMPVHNAAKYLKEAIKSILYQTYTNFEFIIVNDGSTDSSEQIIKSIVDDRVKYHCFEKQQGIVAALNFGLGIAQGDFIARMDADDISLKHRLEKQVAMMLNNPEIGILGTQYIGINGRSRALPVLHDDIVWHTLNASPFVHPSVMFRADFVRKCNITYASNFQFAEDLAMWVACFSKTRLANLNEPLIKYRYHNGTHKKNLETVAALNTEIKQELIKQLLPGLSALQQLTLANYLNRHVKQAYSIDWFKQVLVFFDEVLLTSGNETRLKKELNKCVWFHLTAYPKLYFKLQPELSSRKWIKLGVVKTVWLWVKSIK
jgi:glycosyltransferase involved in cell wall biosynthesis